MDEVITEIAASAAETYEMPQVLVDKINSIDSKAYFKIIEATILQGTSSLLVEDDVIKELNSKIDVIVDSTPEGVISGTYVDGSIELVSTVVETVDVPVRIMVTTEGVSVPD